MRGRAAHLIMPAITSPPEASKRCAAAETYAAHGPTQVILPSATTMLAATGVPPSIGTRAPVTA